MHLSRPGGAHHVDEPTGSRAADDGVIDHYHAFTAKYFAHCVVLDLHLRVASSLSRLKESPSNVVVADERELQRQARLLGEPEGSGVRRIGNGKNKVCVRRGEVAGKPAAQLTPGAVDRSTEHLT